MSFGKGTKRTKIKNAVTTGTAEFVFYRGAFQRRAFSGEIESPLFPAQSIGHSQVLVTVGTIDDTESP